MGHKLDVSQRNTTDYVCPTETLAFSCNLTKHNRLAITTDSLCPKEILQARCALNKTLQVRMLCPNETQQARYVLTIHYMLAVPERNTTG